MTYARNLRCRECSRDYPLAALHVCEFCFGPLEVVYDDEAIRKDVSREKIASRPSTLWRYREFLPCDADTAVDIGAGFTPLIHARNLGKALGLPNLYIKNDTVNPDLVLQGPRRRHCQFPRARARLREAGLRQHGQPRQ